MSYVDECRNLQVKEYRGFPAAAAAAAAKSLQSCPTLCDPIDGSPLGSSVSGILQARILEWGAIAFSDLPPYCLLNSVDVLPTKKWSGFLWLFLQTQK